MCCTRPTRCIGAVVLVTLRIAAHRWTDGRLSTASQQTGTKAEVVRSGGCQQRQPVGGSCFNQVDNWCHDRIATLQVHTRACRWRERARPPVQQLTSGACGGHGPLLSAAIACRQPQAPALPSGVNLITVEQLWCFGRSESLWPRLRRACDWRSRAARQVREELLASPHAADRASPPHPPGTATSRSTQSGLRLRAVTPVNPTT